MGRPLLLLVMLVALAGCAAGDTESLAKIHDVPLPGTAQQLDPVGTTTEPGARRSLYVLGARLGVAQVAAFYDRELPRGEDLGDWSWCGARDETARAWRRGGRVLTLDYFAHDGSVLPEIPRDRVIAVVEEQAVDAAARDHEECAPDS